MEQAERILERVLVGLALVFLAVASATVLAVALLAVLLALPLHGMSQLLRMLRHVPGFRPKAGKTTTR